MLQFQYTVPSIELPPGVRGRKLTLTFTKGIGVDEIKVFTCVKPGKCIKYFCSKCEQKFTLYSKSNACVWRQL